MTGKQSLTGSQPPLERAIIALVQPFRTAYPNGDVKWGNTSLLEDGSGEYISSSTFWSIGSNHSLILLGSSCPFKIFPIGVSFIGYFLKSMSRSVLKLKRLTRSSKPPAISLSCILILSTHSKIEAWSTNQYFHFKGLSVLINPVPLKSWGYRWLNLFPKFGVDEVDLSNTLMKSSAICLNTSSFTEHQNDKSTSFGISIFFAFS